MGARLKVCGSRIPSSEAALVFLERACTKMCGLRELRQFENRRSLAGRDGKADKPVKEG